MQQKFRNHYSIFSYYIFIVTLATVSINCHSQNFIRSELTTSLTAPWEIIYGPDNYLWISESGGKIARVDPKTGNKKTVYTAADYYAGDTSETNKRCFNPKIGSGTLGMALHPDFLNTPTIYLVYSYNSGTAGAPRTRFKIQKLWWDAIQEKVTRDSVLVPMIHNGYDHLGGRLIAVIQNNLAYLYLSVGDNGISETNEPTCYKDALSNPNIHAQNPDSMNGKILRFNIDGSIPGDNPIVGNAFYTRGHRNPQGLIFNADKQLVYDVEHGDRTDDEINLLEKGMNYGWKNVRGYHGDSNFPGEASYIAGYTPDARIQGDGLRAPIYAWCATPQPTTSFFIDWCTVAPSDGIYYNSAGIPGWKNSLLVVTLKDGPSTDMQLFRVKLNDNGKTIAASTPSLTNPQPYFGADQKLNGRLRDICVSPDGRKLFLINNGGAQRDKITIYTCTDSIPADTSKSDTLQGLPFKVYPIPVEEYIKIGSIYKLKYLKIYDAMGKLLYTADYPTKDIEVSSFASGFYVVEAETQSGYRTRQKVLKLKR